MDITLIKFSNEVINNSLLENGHALSFSLPLNIDFSLFNIFRYITFRSLLAFLLAAVISILWGRGLYYL